MLSFDRTNLSRVARWALSAAVAGAALLGARPASAFPLLNGLGGLADYGESRLHQNDDGSSTEIDLAAAFPMGLEFFGRRFTSVYVNNNGNVTMGGAQSEFTPAPFPIAGQRMIAPWWGDVDTRGRQTPTQNSVYWDISPGRFVATWSNVGYYGIHDDRLNDFQLILTERRDVRPGDFDVEFRYNRCEWTTGDASGGTGGFGGTPAQAGFDAGDRMNFLVLPGSRTMAVLELCRTSNVGAAGLWRFQIRNGRVSTCGNGRVEPGEECDDGNTRSGDGCSRVCVLEREFPPDAAVDAGPDATEDAAQDAGPDIVVREWGPEGGAEDVPPWDDATWWPDVPINDDVVTYPGDAVRRDGGTGEACVGWRCGRENRLTGRAGPLGGCACSAAGASGGAGGRGWLAAVVAAGAVFGVRRRRRSREKSRGSALSATA